MNTYSIRDVARLTGLSTYTLRYYERIGLLDPVERKPNGLRRYGQRSLDQLAFINRLRTTGMRIAEMQRYAELRREGEATLKARQDLLMQHRDQVAQRIQDLQTALMALDSKIDWYQQQPNLKGQ